jgi:hypothetical protein
MALKEWIELCDAAGFDTRRMSAMEVYKMGGRIIADEILRMLCLPFIENNILKKGTREKVMGLMSEADLVQLRIRVSG